jgi:curved DNA-binding protein CbpA
MEKNIDYYQILEIAKTASLPEIKKAFREKALLFHPDHNPDPEAVEKFKAIQEAYDILSDPALRQEYDQGKKSAVTDKPRDFLTQLWAGLIKQGLKNRGR